MSVEMPRKGDPVYFYSPGNSVVPSVATVDDVWSGDMVSLIVWEVNRYVLKHSVNRKGCAALIASPMIEQKMGCWDYRDPPEVRKAMAELIALSVQSKQPPKPKV